MSSKSSKPKLSSKANGKPMNKITRSMLPSYREAVTSSGKKRIVYAEPREMGFYQNLSNKPPRNPHFPVGMSGRGRQRMILVEDEYVGDINGSVSFALTQYAVNPGNSTTFPWLNTVGKQFEKYRFLGLEFYYKPEVSGFATNGSAGKIILSFDTDAADPAPANKTQMEDTDPHADGMPYESISLPLGEDVLRSMVDAFFVRPGLLPGGTDIKTYDIGVLNVGTIACANTTLIGEIRVRYAVELIRPVLEATAAPVNFRVAQFVSASGSETGGATTVAKTLLLATAQVNGIGAVNASGVITLQAGNYVVSAVSNFLDSTANMTVIQTDLLVGGVSQQPVLTTTVTSGEKNVEQSGSWFVSSTGTQTVALRATATYSGGTLSLNGSLLIQSV